jgi:hypothetical protein
VKNDYCDDHNPDFPLFSIKITGKPCFFLDRKERLALDFINIDIYWYFIMGNAGEKDCFNIKASEQQLAVRAQVFSIVDKLQSRSLVDLPAELDQWTENVRRLAEEGEPETALFIASSAIFRWSIVVAWQSPDEQQIRDLAQHTAIREFTQLADTHKASAARVLNSAEMHGFDQISDLIDGKFDPWTLLDDIVKSLPPGTVEKKPRKFLKPGQEFC